MGDDLDYSQLDEGIRDAVRLVRSHGFVTTDSGDGRLDGAKAEMEGVLPFPHVVVRLDDVATMVHDTWRLHSIGAALGDDWRAELSWSPGGPGLVMLLCGGWEAGTPVGGPGHGEETAVGHNLATAHVRRRDDSEHE
jgi:hypothetical protein